ncbi:ATP-binding protein [Marilutibacter maris]|uniref:histidine kinase n=1 Tax=Marilutibacter maris TaxID=1605891 RepID=A0A2U9T321_9GAMM|nr:ATP-binding protein [Lysobacter maris]AWV05755.1 histidine kinase [Lysobacter maris]KAB8194396.1 two-component sensor histidine kinase [Lysobacter maris]
MKTRSLRWRLTFVAVKCVLVAWLIWLGCLTWQLTRSHSGFWDASLREIAAQILGSMPDGLERLPSRPHDADAAARPPVDHKMSFQVWLHGRNVVYSAAAPFEPLKPDFIDGFARRRIDGETWHVYSLHDPARGLIVQVGRSKQMIATELWGLMMQTLAAATLIFALFVLMVWIVLGRSLRPITALRNTLQSRPPLDLTPLQAPDLPREFHPLVAAFNEQLTRVDQAVQNERRFIADAAHELRTPLAVLSAHADVARRAGSEAERDLALRRLSAGVQRSTRLSEQLLDLARLDAATGANALAPVELAGLVVIVVRDFEALARERGQRISLRTEPGTIRGDIDQLGILLRNLVDNAVRHAGDGGQIAVACRGEVRDGVSGLALCVADDGPGVPDPDERERIFDRFYRVQSGAGNGGSGIGLSLVARIARTHGATIAVGDGLDGRGLSVTVFFPGD